jgi:hypothetical protein
MGSNPLPYAAPSLKPPIWRRHFHVWLLPLVWLPGAWGATIYYGDEYFAFGMAHAPTGIALFPFIEQIQRYLPGERGFILFVAVGILHWLVVGWLLDRLRAWRWVYLLMPVVFAIIVNSRVAMPGHVPPLPYYPGQERELDALCVASCWAVYAVAMQVLIGAGVAALVRRVMRMRRGAPGYFPH